MIHKFGPDLGTFVDLPQPIVRHWMIEIVRESRWRNLWTRIDQRRWVVASRIGDFDPKPG
ncbi:MAG: hypothetical protein CMJ83_07415 [Planctomycetes bacterium]|nr:hypothetical protein [Planctomycetota bacterium]